MTKTFPAEDGSAARAEAAEAALTALDRDMQALLSTRTMRYTSGLRKLYGRLRKT